MPAKRITLCFLLVVLFSACATTQDIVPDDYRLPTYKEVQLKNGLRLLFLPNAQIPFLSLHLMLPTGSVHDPKGKSGISHLTQRLLSEGTRKRSAKQIAQDLDFYGIEFGARVGLENTNISINGLSQFEEQIYQNFHEMLFEASFPAAELERRRKESLEAILRLGENPSALADLYSAEFLFGEHPMGRMAVGKVEDVKSIQIEEIRVHHERMLRPQGAVLAIVGRYSDSLRAKILADLGSWESSQESVTSLPKVVRRDNMELRLYSKDSLQQSQVRLMHLGPARGHKDYMPLRLANMILGGNFASRLMQEIRVKRGLTYGIYSQFHFNKELGNFSIASSTRNDKVGELIAVSIDMYREIYEKGLSQEELRQAKNVILSNYPKAIETSDALAGNLIGLRFFGIGDDYLSDFVENVEAVSLAEVNAAIRRHMRPDSLKIVVVGPSSVAKQLSHFSNLSVVPIQR